MNPYLLDLLLLPTSIQKRMKLVSIRIKKHTCTFGTQKRAYRILLVIVVFSYICICPPAFFVYSIGERGNGIENI
jgi:hypothetical protein